MAKKGPGPIRPKIKMTDALRDAATYKPNVPLTDPGGATDPYAQYMRHKMGKTPAAAYTPPGTPTTVARPVENATVARSTGASSSHVPITEEQQKIAGTGKGGALGKMQKAFDAATPYISNAVNALRKPPAPTAPKRLDHVQLSKPSADAELNEVDRAVRVQDMAADRGLDANSASAVRAANLATGLKAKGQISQAYANMGAQIGNEQAKINAGIDAQNIGNEVNYQDKVLGMQIAHSREQSGNLANAADKRMQEVTRRDQMQLDRDKMGILSKAYGQSGVTKRLVANALGKKPEDTTDEDIAAYGNGTITRAMGGPLRKLFATGGTLLGGENPGDKKRPKPAPVGGTTPPAVVPAPPKPAPTPLTPEEMNEWNSFQDWVGTQGLAGSKDLDNRDVNRGQELFNKYKTANPNTRMSYDLVPRAQAEFLKYQKTHGAFKDRKGIQGGDQFDQLSKEDGWYGSYTSQQKFIPLMVKNSDGSQTNKGLMNGAGIPTSERAAGDTTGGSEGVALPAGVKPIKADDGQYYVKKADGDVISLQQLRDMQRRKVAVELATGAEGTFALGGRLSHGRRAGRIKKAY